MQSDQKAIVDAINHVTSVVSASGPGVESPASKKQRQFHAVSENIKLLLQEKKALKEAGEPTADVEEQIRGLQAERKTLNRAQGSGATANLGSAFGDAA